MRTCIKAWMSLFLSQIRPFTRAALECLKIDVSTVAIDPILFNLHVMRIYIHDILDEFNFQPDWTIDCGFGCPCACKKTPLIYNGSQVSDRCPLGYLLDIMCVVGP